MVPADTTPPTLASAPAADAGGFGLDFLLSSLPCSPALGPIVALPGSPLGSATVAPGMLRSDAAAAAAAAAVGSPLLVDVPIGGGGAVSSMADSNGLSFAPVQPPSVNKPAPAPRRYVGGLTPLPPLMLAGLTSPSQGLLTSSPTGALAAWL